MRLKTPLAVVLGAVTFVAIGCSENLVTRHHYDMIVKDKSTRLEVEKTLGDTYVDRGDHWEYDEEDRHLSVVFYFNDKGLVTRKEWIDASTGEWDGAAPGINEKPQGKKFSDDSSTTTIKEP
jgi:hypothetical protein